MLGGIRQENCLGSFCCIICLGLILGESVASGMESYDFQDEGKGVEERSSRRCTKEEEKGRGTV